MWEESHWEREEGKTTYHRALSLLKAVKDPLFFDLDQTSKIIRIKIKFIEKRSRS